MAEGSFAREVYDVRLQSRIDNPNMRPLHDHQASDSMPETALGWGDGAA
jgi:hypothetical protein